MIIRRVNTYYFINFTHNELGIPQRIKAFERMLIQYPVLVEKIILIQIAVPSRETVKEYVSQKNMIEQLVSQVNGVL